MKDAVFDYSSIFDGQKDGIISRDISLNDEDFAELVAQNMLNIIGRTPSLKSAEISTRLQGNLCEFCIWDLGDQHWKLYSKSNTVTANAKSPWRDNSKSGIDIVAISEDGKRIFLIEVKSTQGGGSDAIFNEESSLKADFQHLFEVKSVEERIWGSIDEIIADLKIRGKSDIAESVKNGVGSTPDECTGIKLVGVIVCKKGENIRSHNARKEAFENLTNWLIAQGWGASQHEYRTVEVIDFENWLQKFVRWVTA